MGLLPLNVFFIHPQPVMRAFLMRSQCVASATIAPIGPVSAYRMGFWANVFLIHSQPLMKAAVNVSQLV